MFDGFLLINSKENRKTLVTQSHIRRRSEKPAKQRQYTNSNTPTPFKFTKIIIK